MPNASWIRPVVSTQHRLVRDGQTDTRHRTVIAPRAARRYAPSPLMAVRLAADLRVRSPHISGGRRCAPRVAAPRAGTDRQTDGSR